MDAWHDQSTETTNFSIVCTKNSGRVTIFAGAIPTSQRMTKQLPSKQQQTMAIALSGVPTTYVCTTNTSMLAAH